MAAQLPFALGTELSVSVTAKNEAGVFISYAGRFNGLHDLGNGRFWLQLGDDLFIPLENVLSLRVRRPRPEVHQEPPPSPDEAR